ncbi:hypothetical protein IWX49DRAFT_569943 [Phyllosticta citricarpa]
MTSEAARNSSTWWLRSCSAWLRLSSASLALERHAIRTTSSNSGTLTALSRCVSCGMWPYQEGLKRVIFDRDARQ